MEMNTCSDALQGVPGPVGKAGPKGRQVKKKEMGNKTQQYIEVHHVFWVGGRGW